MVLPVHALKLKESLIHHIISQHKIQDIKLIKRCYENLSQVKYEGKSISKLQVDIELKQI